MNIRFGGGEERRGGKGGEGRGGIFWGNFFGC